MTSFIVSASLVTFCCQKTWLLQTDRATVQEPRQASCTEKVCQIAIGKMSPLYALNSAGCEFQRGYSSGYVFWCIIVFISTPSYLAEMFHPTTDYRRSAATPTLLVPSTRRSSLGDRAFPVAASRAAIAAYHVPADLSTSSKDAHTAEPDGYAASSSAAYDVSVNCTKCRCNIFV